jgi:hypothetical protein
LYHLERYGLKLDFRPIFPFWGGFGRDNPFFAQASLTLPETSVYQRVNGGCGFSVLLEDGAPALPVRDHCRIGRVARLCGWSRMNVMKNPVVDKGFAACGSHVGCFEQDQRARPSRAWTGHPLEFQRAAGPPVCTRHKGPHGYSPIPGVRKLRRLRKVVRTGGRG